MDTPREVNFGIFLGAKKFPDYPEMDCGDLFENSHQFFKDYMRNERGGMAASADQIIDLFDDGGNADSQMANIRFALSQLLHAYPGKTVNLFIHYVGHGAIDPVTKSLCLMLRQTSASYPHATMLPALDLARTLRQVAPHTRRFVILDCCYSGHATGVFLLAPDVLRQKAEEVFSDPVAPKQRQLEHPTKGCSLLCASDARTPAIAVPGETYTRFSAALKHALEHGINSAAPLLSLSEVRDLTLAALGGDDRNVRPFLNSPEAPEGDIATKVKIFPNPAMQAGPEPQARTQQAAGQLTSGGRRLTFAHLSDLHFGSAGQVKIWKTLALYLMHLRPQLLLITGNIVDHPDKKNFERARVALDDLKIPYIVCPGSNDRAAFGAAAGDAGEAANFMTDFHDKIAALHGADAQRVFQSGSLSWKICFFSLDTSHGARDAQQGFLLPSDLALLQRESAKVRKDSDLCIVLQHHCLLPVSTAHTGAVEAAVMQNAGDLLETLAMSNINLVLHGHVHRHFASRYATVNGNKNEVTIVAAGSATGATQNKACKAADACFNLLELRDNHTVWLEEQRCEQGVWGPGKHGPFQLYTSEALRKIHINRSGAMVGTPTSKIFTHFEFTPERDINIRRVCTNWMIEPEQLVYEVFNSTGTPVCRGVSIDWADGPAAIQTFDAQYHMKTRASHAYFFAVPLPNREWRRARSLTIDTSWPSGALLTDDDLQMLPKDMPRGDFRSDGKEHVYTVVKEPLEMLTVSLSLPENIAPDIGDLHVIAESTDSDAPDLASSAMNWVRPLDLGHGKYVLNIFYPLINMRYGFSWFPPKIPRNNASAFKDFAAVYGAGLLAAVKDALSMNLKRGARLTLYCSSNGGTPSPYWTQKAVMDYQPGQELPNTRLYLSNRSSIYKLCWWGRISVVKISEVPEQDLFGDEQAVIVIPMRLPEADPRLEPAAMIRIGYPAFPDGMNPATLHPLIKKVQFAFLNFYLNNNPL